MPYETVLIDRRENGVALLVLNRPDAMNSLNSTLMRELPHAARELAEDEDVRCIVLTGAGDVFCAGGDTRAIGKMADDQVKSAAPPKSSFEKRAAWLAKCSQASRILHQAPKPVIAMINGACAGAGLNLAGACDIRYAGASAKFRSAFIAMGLSSDYGGNWSSAGSTRSAPTTRWRPKRWSWPPSLPMHPPRACSTPRPISTPCCIRRLSRQSISNRAT